MAKNAAKRAKRESAPEMDALESKNWEPAADGGERS